MKALIIETSSTLPTYNLNGPLMNWGWLIVLASPQRSCTTFLAQKGKGQGQEKKMSYTSRFTYIQLFLTEYDDVFFITKAIIILWEAECEIDQIN